MKNKYLTITNPDTSPQYFGPFETVSEAKEWVESFNELGPPYIKYIVADLETPSSRESF